MAETREERMRSALEDIRDFCDGRADADCIGDPPRFVPNKWMELLMMAEEGLRDG